MRAVIVGGSSGIGAATRKRLDDTGWDTYSIDRTNGVPIEERRTYAKALGWYFGTGHVDALVYSAGHVEPGPITELTLDGWDHHVEVNLTGAYRALAIAGRQKRPCAVVLVASTAGTRPSPGWAAYAATKAALVNLAESAHAELRPAGHRVYAVTPGRCATPLRATLAPDEDPSTIMQPAEVAAVICHLIDDKDGTLAGHPIRVAR